MFPSKQGHLTERQFRKHLQDCCESLDLIGFTPQHFRNFVGNILYKQTDDIFFVANYLGNQTTQGIERIATDHNIEKKYAQHAEKVMHSNIFSQDHS